MANTKDYDPTKVTVLIGGLYTVAGFADGTFVTASRTNQTWNLISGASGEHSRSKNQDKSGTFELTLMQTSATNNILSQYMLLDENSGQGKFPIAILDDVGTTIVEATQAWVQQPPSVEYGKELGDRTWTLEAGSIEFYVGGIDIPEMDAVEPISFN